MDIPKNRGVKMAARTDPSSSAICAAGFPQPLYDQLTAIGKLFVKKW